MSWSAIGAPSTTTPTWWRSSGRLEPYDALVADLWIRTYALLVWVPPIDAPSFDGVRDTDLRYQRDIDRILGELLDAFDLQPVKLDPLHREGSISR